MKTYIQSLNIVNNEELDFIDTYITLESIDSKDILLNNNSICRKLYFVKSGALRSFYVNNDGEEVTNCIAFENEFMCDFSSFVSQERSQKTIHALLESEVEVIKYQDLEDLYNSSIGWQKVGRKLIEQQYILMEHHVSKYQEFSSINRYQQLLEKHKYPLSLIPQHYIASYLGISTRQLTRIRKSLL